MAVHFSIPCIVIVPLAKYQSAATIKDLQLIIGIAVYIPDHPFVVLTVAVWCKYVGSIYFKVFYSCDAESTCILTTKVAGSRYRVNAIGLRSYFCYCILCTAYNAVGIGRPVIGCARN